MPFTSSLVVQVSEFLQAHMKCTDILEMTADECAELLAKNGLLANDVGPRPGFNFRQMLREGRDGLIPLVAGAEQDKPRTRWRIHRLDCDHT